MLVNFGWTMWNYIPEDGTDYSIIFRIISVESSNQMLIKIAHFKGL
jgi:hypothetical protein